MLNKQLSTGSVEIIPPSLPSAPYDLRLPDCKSISADEYDKFRIVHAVYLGLPKMCPCCGSRSFKRIKIGERNLWDNPDGSTLVAIHLYIPKLRCLGCGAPIWCNVPWIHPKTRITSRLVATILDYLAEEQSFAQIAARTGVNAAKIQQFLREAHAKLDLLQDNRLDETTGVDDFWLAGKPVTTIGGTSPGGSLIRIVEATDVPTLRNALSEFSNGDEVKNLTLDFSQTFAKAALTGTKNVPVPFPNAKPAVNRFHYAKYVIGCFNAARNQVFKQIRADLKKSDPVSRQQFLFELKSGEQLKREANKRARKAAKPIKSMFWNLRRLLTKRPEKLNEEGKAIVDFILHKYPLLDQAYELKNFALNMRGKKTTEEAMAEFEMFQMRLGKLSRKRGGKAIVKCFVPFVNLIEKWKEAAFPTIAGSNNNLEQIHRDMRTFIRLGRGYSIPGLVRRMQWRAAKKRRSRWSQEFAGTSGMTLRRAVAILRRRKGC